MLYVVEYKNICEVVIFLSKGFQLNKGGEHKIV